MAKSLQTLRNVTCAVTGTFWCAKTQPSLEAGFIVVRHKRSPLHIPLCKVNSSKGTRIKYRLEDSENSFDSIAELINYHITQRKPLSPKTSAIITHAVSRDATLLSADDLKSLNANQQKQICLQYWPFQPLSTETTRNWAFKTKEHRQDGT